MLNALQKKALPAIINIFTNYLIITIMAFAVKHAGVVLDFRDLTK